MTASATFARFIRSRLLWILIVPTGYSAWFVLFFSPILFGDKLFPSDGTLAAFFAPVELWNTLPLAGVPGLGDPQLQQLYPLRWLFAALPREIGFNLFMVFSYVLASSLSFGYAFTLTRSVLAATVSGLVFGMSGYMMAHLGHTGLVPAAAWLPLILWSLENLRRKVSLGWLVIAAVSVAIIIIAGHPQAFTYSIYLAFAYAVCLGSTSSIGWLRYVGLTLLVVCIGSALAAAHIIPMLELADLSVRSEMQFDAFKQYSLPLTHLPMLVFPYLFGGAYLPNSPSYFGQWNLSEMTGYVGLLTLVLAGIGCSHRWNDRLGAFWVGAAAVSFLLALGDATPLLRITYYLPGINKLRAPARHFHEMALALSVLAAFGIHALQRSNSDRKVARRVVTVGAAVMLLGLCFIVIFYNELQTRALTRGTHLPPHYANPALWMPLLAFIFSAIALFYWLRQVDSHARKVLLVMVLAIDLGSFGWFAGWRWGPPSTILSTPDFVAKYLGDLTVHRQRLMAMLGWEEPVLPFSTMMSQLYGIPSVGGYGALLIQRYASLSLATNAGWINPSVLLPADRAADLLAARYIVVPRSESLRPASKQGMHWSDQDLSIGLGTGCGTSNPKQARIFLPAALHIDRIGIVSKTACSTTLEQAQEIATVTVTDASGNSRVRTLRAGRDTAEWAIDCADVTPITKHARATVFDSWDTVRAGFPTCQGHRFVSELAVEAGSYKELLIDWIPETPNVMTISKISLLDSRTGRSYAVGNYDFLFADSARFQHVEDFESSSVYRNLRAMPRAWLVSEVIFADGEEVLKAVRSSVMPDGRAYDPARMALVEEPFTLKSNEQAGFHSAVVVDLSGARVEITTQAPSPAFLVLSDVYYPGWTATIDGQETKIFRTNYALRGVAVPSGGHTVVFHYRPASFRLGLMISTLAALALAAFVIYARRKKTIAHLARAPTPSLR